MAWKVLTVRDVISKIRTVIGDIITDEKEDVRLGGNAALLRFQNEQIIDAIGMALYTLHDYAKNNHMKSSTITVASGVAELPADFRKLGALKNSSKFTVPFAYPTEDFADSAYAHIFGDSIYLVDSWDNQTSGSYDGDYEMRYLPSYDLDDLGTEVVLDPRWMVLLVNYASQALLRQKGDENAGRLDPVVRDQMERYAAEAEMAPVNTHALTIVDDFDGGNPYRRPYNSER